MALAVAAEVIPDLEGLEEDIERGVRPEVDVDAQVQGGTGAASDTGRRGGLLGGRGGGFLGGVGAGELMEHHGGGALGGIGRAGLVAGAIAGLVATLKPVTEFLKGIHQVMSLFVAPAMGVILNFARPFFSAMNEFIPVLVNILKNPQSIMAPIVESIKATMNLIAQAVNAVLPGSPLPTLNVDQSVFGAGTDTRISGPAERRRQRQRAQGETTQEPGLFEMFFTDSISGFDLTMPEHTDEAKKQSWQEIMFGDAADLFPGG